MSKKILKIFGVLTAVIILAFGVMAFTLPEPVYASAPDGRGGPGGNG
jgi:hypothetical protein